MSSRTYRLERVQLVPQPLDTVFAFFANAGNLEAITPKFLRFRVLTPLPIRMEPGAVIEYQLQLFSIPFRWLTRIETFELRHYFTDIQLVGPYRRWHHLHEFSEVSGGTLVRDQVDYELPFGPFGAVAHLLFVRRMLERIFDYRRERIAEILGRGEGNQVPSPSRRGEKPGTPGLRIF